MSSPLAPVLANLFMGHHERIWLQQYDGPAVYFYRRYVDDTFCLFNNEKGCIGIFPVHKWQTPQHQVHHGDGGQPQTTLDVLFDNSNPAQSLVTSVFHKSTYTGLLTNFLSFSPFSYKLGPIRMLVERTFKINNNWTGFHNNIKELSNILEKNQFPSRLVSSIVKQYLNKFFASTSRASTVTSPNETHTHYNKLPFVGPFSSTAQRRIRCLTQCFCKNLEIKLVFAPSRSRTYSALRMQFQKPYVLVWFTNFLTQAVAPAM